MSIRFDNHGDYVFYFFLYFIIFIIFPYFLPMSTNCALLSMKKSRSYLIRSW